MPKNTVALMLAYPHIFSHPTVQVISLQDVKSWYLEGKMEDLDKVIIEEENEGEDTYDELKVIFNYQNPTFLQSMQKYGHNLSDKFQKYLKMLEETGIDQILPVKVDHCPQSHGVVIKAKSGWSLSYSGDCRPTQEFAEAGKDSTVLIHEATFTSDKLEDAKKKMHTTVEEAARMGMNMKAERLVLTHFSQRYTISSKKVGNMFNVENEKIIIQKYLGERAVYAMDHLNFSFEDLEYMPEINPLLTFFVGDEQH